MEIRLIRTDSTPDGVFGRLLVPGHVALMTCEDDEHALKGASCIPAGTYVLRKTIYFKHDFPTYEVTGVPGRSRVLIHPGNTEEDTLGCILVGLKLSWLQVRVDEDTGKLRPTKMAVSGSRVAFKLFMSWMGDRDGDTLVVEWAPGLHTVLPPVA